VEFGVDGGVGEIMSHPKAEKTKAHAMKNEAFVLFRGHKTDLSGTVSDSIVTPPSA
jgi:hypothetical protein